MTVWRLNLMKDMVSSELNAVITVPEGYFFMFLSLGHLMDSVQSLTDEVALLRKENVALTRENTVSRIQLSTPPLMH